MNVPPWVPAGLIEYGGRLSPDIFERYWEAEEGSGSISMPLATAVRRSKSFNGIASDPKNGKRTSGVVTYVNHVGGWRARPRLRQVPIRVGFPFRDVDTALALALNR